MWIAVNHIRDWQWQAYAIPDRSHRLLDSQLPETQYSRGFECLILTRNTAQN